MKRKNKLVIGGELVKAGGFECFFSECYKDESGKPVMGADAITPPVPPSEKNNKTNDNIDIPPPPPPDSPSKQNEIGTNDTSINTPTDTSNNEIRQPETSPDAPKKRSWLGRFSRDKDKPPQPKRTMFSRLASGYVDAAIRYNPVLKNLTPEERKKLTGIVGSATSNVTMGDAAHGFHGMHSFTRGDMGAAFSDRNLGTINKGLTSLSNIPGEKKGGTRKKRTKKVRRNKKQSKRSKK